MKPLVATTAALVAVLGLTVSCDNGGVLGPYSPHVIEPSGAVPWVTGTTRGIAWSADPGTDLVCIELCDDDVGGAPVSTIVASTDAAAGMYSWPVSAPAPGIYFVHVVDVGRTWLETYSDPFEIVDPGIHITSPKAGEAWKVGDTEHITWHAEAATVAGVSQVKIEVSRDNGGLWTELSASADASLGAFDWTVTDGGLSLPQAQCIVRVSDAESVVPSSDSGLFAVFSGVWHVSLSGDGSDGLTWTTAFQHPQDAVDAAEASQEIWVAEGTYTFRAAEDIVVLEMRDGIDIYGGFAGSETLRADRDWTTRTTTLDGAGAALHVVTAASTSTFDGFVVTGGDSTDKAGAGAGLYGPLLTDLCVRNCEFKDNVSSHSGGGMWLALGSNIVIEGCRFFGNTAVDGGGGASLDADTLHLARCVFEGNDGGIGGAGGVAVSANDAEIVNCLVTGNLTAGSGGGIWTSGDQIVITNCSVTHNSASVFGCGGGILGYECIVAVDNSVLWGNTAYTYPQLVGCAVSYSDVEGGSPGVGNIDADPLFVDAAGGDYSLQTGSPCIDTADPATSLTEDIDGNPRPAGSGYDMGAYEYQP